jgi:beta-glucosidase
MDAVLPTQPVDGTLPYTEELRIGYRAHSAGDPRPLFAFGSGMGYTSWQLDSVSAPASAEPGQPIRIDVRVRNTGARAGRQVVQAYVSRPDSAVARPERWLAGFAGVHLDAGAEATVTVTVPGRAFAHWDVASDDWAVEAGGYEIRVGTSSALDDLCQAVAVTLVG